jgi:hypothetical protein
MTLSIMTLSIKTLSIMAVSITTLRILTLIIMDFIATLTMSGYELPVSAARWQQWSRICFETSIL